MPDRTGSHRPARDRLDTGRFGRHQPNAHIPHVPTSPKPSPAAISTAMPAPSARTGFRITTRTLAPLDKPQATRRHLATGRIASVAPPIGIPVSTSPARAETATGPLPKGTSNDHPPAH